jgi:hypothetical protein
MTLTKIKCLIAAFMMISSGASAIWPFTTYYVIYAKAINPRNGVKFDKYYSAGKPWTEGAFTVYKDYETNLEMKIKTNDVSFIDELKEAPKPNKPGTAQSASEPLAKTPHLGSKPPPWNEIEGHPTFQGYTPEQKSKVLSGWSEQVIELSKTLEEKLAIEAIADAKHKHFAGAPMPEDMSSYIQEYAKKKAAKDGIIYDKAKLEQLIKKR